MPTQSHMHKTQQPFVAGQLLTIVTRTFVCGSVPATHSRVVPLACLTNGYSITNSVRDKLQGKNPTHRRGWGWSIPKQIECWCWIGKGKRGPLPSRGPKSGRKCYVTPAFSGVPKQGNKIRIHYLTPYLLGGPEVGRNAMSPLHSRGSPNKATKSEVATSPLPSRGPNGGENGLLDRKTHGHRQNRTARGCPL